MERFPFEFSKIYPFDATAIQMKNETNQLFFNDFAVTIDKGIIQVSLLTWS